MTRKAKLFKNGQSQAVRLPKEFRFEDQDELFIKRVEDGILLMSKKDHNIWDHMFEKLDDFSDDFMNDRKQLEQNREELY